MRIRANEKFSIWRGRMFTLSWFLLLVLIALFARTKDDFPAFAYSLPLPPMAFVLYLGFFVLCALQIGWVLFKLWANKRASNAILLSDPLPKGLAAGEMQGIPHRSGNAAQQR